MKLQIYLRFNIPVPKKVYYFYYLSADKFYVAKTDEPK